MPDCGFQYLKPLARLFSNLNVLPYKPQQPIDFCLQTQIIKKYHHFL